MAIGGNRDEQGGNNNNRIFENTYYSRLRFRNDQFKTNLGISFRSGLMIMEISRLQEGNGFKYDPVESIYLSPTKARILAGELLRFKEYLKSGDIVEGKAFGVNAGMGEKVSYIGFHSNADKDILITIGKIDGSGQITNHADTALNKDYHYALEWDNIEAMDLVKNYVDNIELNQIYDLLVDFSKSMSGAYAYATLDLGRYDQRRILNKMNPIYDKLGIERNTDNGGNGGYSRNSFLDNSKSASNHTNIDDIMGE